MYVMTKANIMWAVGSGNSTGLLVLKHPVIVMDVSLSISTIIFHILYPCLSWSFFYLQSDHHTFSLFMEIILLILIFLFVIYILERVISLKMSTQI